MLSVNNFECFVVVGLFILIFFNIIFKDILGIGWMKYKSWWEYGKESCEILILRYYIVVV